MSSDRSHLLHPGAPAWTASRHSQLQRIKATAEQERCGGSRAELLSAIVDYFDNDDTRAAAIDRVCRGNGWMRSVDPLRTASALPLRALPRRMRTGRWYWQAKTGGKYRLVCSLSWPLRVSQLLAKDVLLSAHRPSDHIGDWRGRGPVYHLSRVVTELENGSIVLLADVRNCFASVQPDAVYRLGLLPSDLVEACFDSRRIRLRAPHRGYSASIGCTFDRTGRNGLLSGGSASSLMWAMMIDDMPGALPAGVRANTYVDNIVVVCRSTQECDDAEAALIRYFAEHPAGPFILATSRADAETGFEHLGYDIAMRNGQAVIAIKDAKLSRIGDRLSGIIAVRRSIIDSGEQERFANQLLSPWPMISARSREAMMDYILSEFTLHNAAIKMTNRGGDFGNDLGALGELASTVRTEDS